MITETKVYRLGTYRPRGREAELIIALDVSDGEDGDNTFYTYARELSWSDAVPKICKDFCKLLARRQLSRHRLEVWGRLERK